MRAHADKVTPERKFLTMETPFMEAYVQLLIHTCHSRGAFAMGGMAAQIPVKNNPKLAAAALESVKKDKVRRRTLTNTTLWHSLQQRSLFINKTELYCVHVQLFFKKESAT